MFYSCLNVVCLYGNHKNTATHLPEGKCAAALSYVNLSGWIAILGCEGAVPTASPQK